MEGNVLLADTA